MKLLTIDWETRSKIDIRKTGPWPYAEHESTDILCLALKPDDEPPRFWVNPDIYWHVQIPGNLQQYSVSEEGACALINEAPVIEAHNAAFERAVMEKVAIGKYWWERWLHPSWINRLSCTAARASSMGLPRILDQLCKVLKLSEQKDSRGKELIQRLSIWNEKTESFGDDPKDLLDMLIYCRQDTNAEYDLSRVLNHLNPFERKLWQLDQTINARGIPLDMELVRASMQMIERYEAEEIPKLNVLTGGAVNTPKQAAELVKWCESQGFPIKNMQKETVASALKNPALPPSVREVLELRSKFGKAATSKFQAMVNCASKDDRARDTMMFHGAGTGRWTGKRVQPHNFPRFSLKDDTDFYIDLVKTGRLDVIKALQDDPMKVLSAMVRPAVRAATGKEFVAADFSAIEGRSLAWEAGDQHILEDYNAGRDPYKKVATVIFNVVYEDVTKDQRQFGKIAELACGYRGGPGACRRFGAVGTDAEIRKTYVKPWRANRPGTVQFWADVEQCALNAVLDSRNSSYRCRIVSFGKHKDFLYCRLPSGRMMAYYKPEVAWVGAIKFEEDDNIYKTPLLDSEADTLAALDDIRAKKAPKKEEWAMAKLTVSVESCDSQSGLMLRRPMHGGLWTENITQAIARDVLACAMLRLEAAGYPIVMHIHDEIVAEIPKGSAKLDDYCRVMSEVPSWAPGLPLGAEGWIHKYLIKD